MAPPLEFTADFRIHGDPRPFTHHECGPDAATWPVSAMEFIGFHIRHTGAMLFEKGCAQHTSDTPRFWFTQLAHPVTTGSIARTEWKSVTKKHALCLNLFDAMGLHNTVKILDECDFTSQMVLVFGIERHCDNQTESFTDFYTARFDGYPVTAEVRALSATQGCSVCGVLGHNLAPVPLRCSRCKTRYCSKGCRDCDWSDGHKLVCFPPV